jgi:hypothetical protein
MRKVLENGRCPNHGGLLTGPRTAAGKARISEVQRARCARWRMKHGKTLARRDGAIAALPPAPRRARGTADHEHQWWSRGRFTGEPQMKRRQPMTAAQRAMYERMLDEMVEDGILKVVGFDPVKGKLYTATEASTSPHLIVNPPRTKQ